MKNLTLVIPTVLLALSFLSGNAQCDFLPSSSITNPVDESWLLQWVDPSFAHQATLLFRATDDGFMSTDFHQNSDGVANTITIIKTTDGHVFGGYNENAWSGTSTGTYEVGTEAAFLFEFQ